MGETPSNPDQLDAASARRPIRALPELLVNQIAAGEVVERPSSVVKELVENAIDAGAARVTIEIEQGGIELIRITDDGVGIPPEELALALAPHATSKISAAADLDRIATMGFRGEALASIASVSRLSIRSRTREHTGATEIECEGGRIVGPRPAAGPIGTCVTVRTLFFNTPARRKFLKTVATEQARCVDTTRDLALGNPALGVTVKCDGRVVLDLPPGGGPRDRALDVLGRELESELLEVHADQFDDARGLALWGMVGRPSLARATNKSQHVFVNGRPIRDRMIQHAIAEAFRGLIEPARYPTAFLMLDMSPEGVDVNVHPAKAEVRFRDGSMVHGTILGSIKRSLRAADLTPSILPRVEPATPAWGNRAVLPGAPGLSPQTPTNAAQRFADYLKQLGSVARGTPSAGELREAIQSAAAVPSAFGDFPTGAPSGPISGEAASAAARVEGASSTSYESAGTTGDITAGPFTGTASPAEVVSPADDPMLVAPPRPATRVLQVHKSYLVSQDEQGMLIVDQHALHERVMFEHLLSRVGSGQLESQRLLVPAVVPATQAQIARLDELKPLLDRIGVDASPIGPTDIGVHAFPTFLFDRGVEPIEFLRDLFERAESQAFMPGSEQALRDVLDMMACKAAVKAGDHLADTHLQALMELRDDVERSSNCPHGRPTSIRLTIKELEKLFGRT